jgi:hypothetical protein
MKNNTYSRRSQTMSTVKRSQARIPAACWRSNARHVVAVRRGAGSRPWRCSVMRIAVAELRLPRATGRLGRAGSPSSASFPAQTHDQRLHVLIQRRPPWSTRIPPRADDQATMPAQRVSGLTGPARSGQHAADPGQQGTVGGSSPGRGTWRRRTLSWWPSTRSSRSLAASPRARSPSSWIERHSVR